MRKQIKVLLATLPGYVNTILMISNPTTLPPPLSPPPPIMAAGIGDIVIMGISETQEAKPENLLPMSVGIGGIFIMGISETQEAKSQKLDQKYPNSHLPPLPPSYKL